MSDSPDKVSSNELAQQRTELAKDRNRLAAERTLMAWIRTSLSMITFGFGIDRFFKYLKVTQTEFSIDPVSEERILGMSLIALGVFALIFAIINHWQVILNLEKEQFKYYPQNSLGITVAVLLVFIGLSTYIPLIGENRNLTQLFSLDSILVKNFVSLSIFTIMLALGFSFSLENLLNLWKQPVLLGRSLLAILVLPIAIVILTLAIFDLSPTFTTALILLIVSPGPVLLTRRTAMAGANINFVLHLQITLALLALIFTPLTLKLCNLLFLADSEKVNVFLVFQQVAVAQFFPLIIGVLIKTFIKNFAEEIEKFVTTIANILFMVLAILLIIISFKVVPTLNITSLLIVAVLSVVGLLVGHLLGSGYERGIQSGIAVTVIARNIGLAVFIALSNQRPQVVPAIIAIAIVGIVVGLPYSIWMKKSTEKVSN